MHPVSGLDPASPSPWSKVAGAGVGLAILVGLVVLAFSWPAITSQPKNLPLAVSGSADQIAQLESALEERADGVFAIDEVADRTAAVSAIERREAYGAIVLGAQPEVLTASAASPAVAQLLGGLAAGLQAQLQQALAAQVPEGVSPPTVTVEVSDVVPLAASDPRGTGLIAAAFPVVLGGMIGGIAISVALSGVVRRLVALLVYAIAAGALVAAVLQGWFGALQGDYLVNAGAFALALLAIGAPIVGFAVLAGPAGIAIGPIVFLLFANPISSAAQPLEFLPEPWGAIGQWFPPGAGATLIRDLSYFPAANATFPWLVLAGWAVGGAILVLVGSLARGSDRRARIGSQRRP